MICSTSRNLWGRQVIHIQMLKHAKINSVSRVYKKIADLWDDLLYFLVEEK